MRSSLFSLLSFAICTGLFACGSSKDPSASHANLQTADSSDLGGFCGGFASVPCKAGLRCDRTGPEGSGTCVRDTIQPSGEGGFCGGFGNVPCQAGLDCNRVGPEGWGTCVSRTDAAADARAETDAGSGATTPSAGEEGGFCGGFRAIPCEDGLRCTGDGPEGSGVCIAN